MAASFSVHLYAITKKWADAAGMCTFPEAVRTAAKASGVAPASMLPFENVVAQGGGIEEMTAAAKAMDVSELQIEREWSLLLAAHSSLANACLARFLAATSVHVQEATLVTSNDPARVRLSIALYDAQLPVAGIDMNDKHQQKFETHFQRLHSKHPRSGVVTYTLGDALTNRRREQAALEHVEPRQ